MARPLRIEFSGALYEAGEFFRLHLATVGRIIRHVMLQGQH